jgi:hypothetical protein
MATLTLVVAMQHDSHAPLLPPRLFSTLYFLLSTHSRSARCLIDKPYAVNPGDAIVTFGMTAPAGCSQGKGIGIPTRPSHHHLRLGRISER